MRHEEEDSVDRKNIRKVNKTEDSGSRGSNSRSSSNTELEDLCVFCLNSIRDPLQLACKHLFCRSCFSEYREARNWRADRCPLCRRPLDPLPCLSRPKGGCGLGIILILAFVLLSVGSFFLLLIFW